MSIAIKRASKEFAKLQGDYQSITGVLEVGLVSEESVLQWFVLLEGPQSSPYQGGKFKLIVTLDNDYPNKPPELKFATKIWHPSVAKDGRLCEGLLKDWAPTNSVRDVIPLVMSLFVDPKGHAVLNEAAAEEIENSPSAFNNTAQKMTLQYAK